MENLIFGEWIKISKDTIAMLSIEKLKGKNDSFLIKIFLDSNNKPYKTLIVGGRKVFGNDGRILDFGDAYPYVTEYGKEVITKKFIKAWLD